MEAIEAARAGDNYVLTTGTGSGKSLSYIVPIVDQVLREGSGGRIKAIVVYPMNALANSQEAELEKFLSAGYPDGHGPGDVPRGTRARRRDAERQDIIKNPPDILLTNYVMLELILTRTDERQLVAQAQDLRFLVLDELHTYRGRQGADVALLCRRVREACNADRLQCVGTSATLAGEGTAAEQRAEVADVATRLFGVPVRPDRVIGETLERATLPAETTPDFVGRLTRARRRARPPTGQATTTGSPPTRSPGGSSPPSASRSGTAGSCGPSREPSEATRASPPSWPRRPAPPRRRPPRRCAAALIGGSQVLEPTAGRPVFAFKLHQFVSRGSSAYATLEPEDERIVTLTEQQYAPGDRSRRLFPLAFCRDGGQEYYVVERVVDDEGDRLVPRDLGDTDDLDDHRTLGFLYASTNDPWPDDPAAELDRLPSDWVEEDRQGNPKIRNDVKKLLPKPLWVTPDGLRPLRQCPRRRLKAWMVPTPFRFCLWSGATYAPTVRSDITKMSTLGFEGRSTATTMLTLAVLRFLEAHGHDVPRKLLNFTDNRQDAALQAGHFNDFVQVSLLRAALYQAVADAGDDGLDYTQLGPSVQQALNLPMSEYAQNPEAKYGAERGDRPGPARGPGLPALRRPAGRVAGHRAQPRTGRTAPSRLRLPRRVLRRTRRSGPAATKRSPAAQPRGPGRAASGPCSTTSAPSWPSRSTSSTRTTTTSSTTGPTRT